jgi:hypothetical protein
MLSNTGGEKLTTENTDLHREKKTLCPSALSVVNKKPQSESGIFINCISKAFHVSLSQMLQLWLQMLLHLQKSN